jgi:hypothetical protein
VEFEGCEVCKPDERVKLVAEDEMYIAVSGLRIPGEDIDVPRGPWGSVLLVKVFTFDPFRVRCRVSGRFLTKGRIRGAIRM